MNFSLDFVGWGVVLLGWMHRHYPGTCVGKDEVREQIYEYVKNVSPEGYGVILSGPHPEDELKVVVKSGWPPEQLVVVDQVAHSALYKVPSILPGARVVTSDASEALDLLPAVSWFNGDFMGFSRKVLLAVTSCASRLLEKGFIALTWARGRSSGDSVLAMARRVGDSPLDGVDTLVRLAARRGGAELKLDNYWQYNRRGGMAMGVGVWVN